MPDGDGDGVAVVGLWLWLWLIGALELASCKGDEGPAGIGRGGPWCPPPGILAIAVSDGPGAPEPVGGATHFVQIVDMMVLYTVDTVEPVTMTWLPPDVVVEVTGQVVR